MLYCGQQMVEMTKKQRGLRCQWEVGSRGVEWAYETDIWHCSFPVERHSSSEFRCGSHFI